MKGIYSIYNNSEAIVTAVWDTHAELWFKALDSRFWYRRIITKDMFERDVRPIERNGKCLFVKKTIFGGVKVIREVTGTRA